ncbi:hypothetical protein D9758_010316 [Tetrapyrgos nigripes]|uniref:NAD-dependent epimerase/dehydratase domain-containing protein n=1 Tax=Tetrapyrgos nigripes TaxID=182062 RepID=A0A8H5GAD9_9AGAR|nr:hypothetical protein D9758_010316 [Tetrapyrgos nigripes]
MSKPIALVTGGTGLLGSHVISKLLADGKYVVRAAARSASKLKAIFPNAGSSLQVVEIPGLTSDFTDALKGVSAIVHVASPGFLKEETGEEIFNGAYEGSIHIVQQAIKLGVKKIVVTGTVASLFDTSFSKAFGATAVNEKDFGPVELKDIDKNDPNTMVIYSAAKTIADKKIWEIAHQHPDVDVTVLLPPAIYGPLVPNFPVASRSSLSTDGYVYDLISQGLDTWPGLPIADMVDVRDIARAHAVALDFPPLSGRDKRFIISSGKYSWKKVADLIRKERPELASRLPREDLEAPAQTTAPVDVSFTEDVLGFKDYIAWEETFLAAIDSVLVLERK